MRVDNRAGFMKYNRKSAEKLPVDERIKHHREIYIPQSEEAIAKQAARCMDCGVAYCNYACPLGNVLPDINELIKDNQWHKALDILHKTNNFPEFTGRLCPALCEAACTLGINDEAATTKEIELSVIEKGFKEGWVLPRPAVIKTGQKVAVVGSGPAGLTVAQQLARWGHAVTVYERADEIGGILALGIPDYKLEKWVLRRRLDQLETEGIRFKTGVNVGVDLSVEALKSKYDAVCLCGGSTVPRDLGVDGRELDGIHFAMDYLTQQNAINLGKVNQIEAPINAHGKNVVIIGGGDTGADCLGIAIRQGASEVYQLELMPKPPLGRTDHMPWPHWPMILRTNSAHEEGGERQWSVASKYFSGANGKVQKIHCVQLEWVEDETGQRHMEEVKDSEFTLDADLILFAMGFLHPEQDALLEKLGVGFDKRGNVTTNEQNQTSIQGVFSAGDMHTGQSLVCKAIADGRQAAKAMDDYLKHDA